MNRKQATMRYTHHMFDGWNSIFKMCAAKNGLKSLDNKPLKSAKYYRKQNHKAHQIMNKMELKGLNGDYDN